MLTFDRFKAAIVSLVRAATARTAYAAPRFARVVSAATDASGSTTLDVVPEDPTFPPMGGVPLFHGLPGISLTLATGTRVLVEFSEADPAKPFVRSWAGGETLTSLSIAGGQPAARKGDPVKTVLSATDLSAIAASLVAAGILLPGTPTATPQPVPLNADGTGTNEIKDGSSIISLG